MLQGKMLIAQGGGPTAVINQSLVGAVQEARRWNAGGIYGALHGVSGIINETMVDLGQESDVNLEQVAATPCSALGSTRDKPDLAYCQEIFKVLRAHGIGTFFYIGGNDSSDTLRILADEAKKADLLAEGQRLFRSVLEPFKDNTFNGTPPFDEQNPSAENIARHIIWTVVEDALPEEARKRIENARATIEEAPGCLATMYWQGA